MPLFITSSTVRPNRLNDKKNKDYHTQYARWCMQSMNHPLYRNFVTKTLINWSFYKGGDGQWIFEEDLESFFLDESGDVRNRLKIAKNLIRPMVEQYVGNAVRLAYTARARATSDFAINERESELKKLKFAQGVAANFDFAEKTIKDNFVIGNTPEETEDIFINSWVDNHERDINNLIEYISNDINIDEIKVQCTKHLAISGLGLYKGEEVNGRYIGDFKDPLFYFWDLSAKKPDLSDSEYMGEWRYMDAPSIFERYPHLTNDERQSIERYSQNESAEIHRLVDNYYNTSVGSKIPVYEVYWKDMEVQEYGYVLDDYGYPYFARINHPDSKWKTKDVIEPQNDVYQDFLKGEKTQKIYVDILRYCIFIPKEEISSGGGNYEDIVLEYGEAPYQEKYTIDPSSVEFPYKAYTWAYDKGEVLSPLDDAIQPQRFINRLLSVAESHINNSRGTGSVIAKDAVDPRDGEESIMRNINTSKPIFVDTTRTGSVQNSVGQYGSNLGQGTMSLFNVIKEMQIAMQDVTGINEAMTGTQGGSDALVGVIESQIQRGSLVQEPFYYALTSILRQAYQHMSEVGKRVYADNPRRLAIMTGDRGMEHIIMTKNVQLEDYRVFVERDESKKTARQNGNSLLFTLRQAGLIDDLVFSNLFNRSNSDDIAIALREHQQDKAEMVKVNEQRAAAAQEGQAAAMAQEENAAANRQQAAMDNDNNNRQLDRDAEIDKTMMKEVAKNTRDEMKYLNEQNNAQAPPPNI
tara:strand:- start:342 stop:2591 length:2250 start_codon:yes stop_codon:yes gene_type:complete